MAQRVSRAKQTIKASGVAFGMPSAAELPARLEAVMHVLYLVFSEGYAATSGPEVVRTDLSGEALRLARMLHRLVPDETEAAGLLALLLLGAETILRRSPRYAPDQASVAP